MNKLDGIKVKWKFEEVPMETSHVNHNDIGWLIEQLETHQAKLNNEIKSHTNTISLLEEYEKYFELREKQVIYLTRVVKDKENAIREIQDALDRYVHAKYNMS